MVKLLNEVLVTLVQIAVLVPATYIGVLYLHEEDGPFDIYLRIRRLAGFKAEAFNKLDPNGEQIEITEYVAGDNFFSQIFTCHRCLTPYIAFLVVLFGLLVGFLQFNALLLLIWLSLVGATVYLFEKLGD
ncbi:hypothetical protein LCGC14_2109430 [marine sediment metagenome]|uniref:Uncharacterized protein n=1 Tax=marine sediment metagenome TaxID=412755 RepID=A0A0F9EUN0_9ZZZZ